MLLIFVYSMMCYGLASALVYYSGPFEILSKFRNFIDSNYNLSALFSCMFCLPVNIGFVMSLLSLIFCTGTPFTPFTVLMDHDWYLIPLIVFFDGFYTGAIVSVIDTIVEKLSDNNLKLVNNP